MVEGLSTRQDSHLTGKPGAGQGSPLRVAPCPVQRYCDEQCAPSRQPRRHRRALASSSAIVFGEVFGLVLEPVPGRIPGFAGEGDRQDTEPDAPAAGVQHEVQALFVDKVVEWCWGGAVAAVAGGRTSRWPNHGQPPHAVVSDRRCWSCWVGPDHPLGARAGGRRDGRDVAACDVGWRGIDGGGEDELLVVFLDKVCIHQVDMQLLGVEVPEVQFIDKLGTLNFVNNLEMIPIWYHGFLGVLEYWR